MMTYESTIEYLTGRLASFSKLGKEAYKPGLERTVALSDAFGSPHSRLKVIHVGGTNGKGTVACSLAAVLQSAGYRVGLFTSPHLVDFRERIRVDGEMIPKEKVVDFVERFLAMKMDIEPSFFEFTTVMAFEYFDEMQVDVTVVEVGLGGRLDSTNIVKRPELCVITNISTDHTDLLGTTRKEIAREKAGIIKWGVPVVVGESDREIREVFESKAFVEHAEIVYASDRQRFDSVDATDDAFVYHNTVFGTITSPLTGNYQLKNMATVLVALDTLRRLRWRISSENVKEGLADVPALTGLYGRWTRIDDKPLTIIDGGHNEGGWKYMSRQLKSIKRRKHMVIGFVADKDVTAILKLLPTEAVYYFTCPPSKRALSPIELSEMARKCGIEGECYATVNDAYKAAKLAATYDDMIFIGGSIYLLGDFLRHREAK